MSLNADFIHELRKHFMGDVRLDTTSKILYSTDASMYQIEPLGVAIPKTQDDLQSAVELAAQYKVPILPRGAGSSLGGQAIGHALILDCSRWLDSIVEIDPDSRTATVEPGVVLADLNTAAAKFDLTFGPDPASAERATMGGVIGNNATGAHSILYGMTADHLISADVILGDGSLATWGTFDKDELGRMKDESGIQGEVIRTALEIKSQYAGLVQQNFPVTWRNSAGYRLNYLLPFSPSKPPCWNGAYPNIHPSSISLQPLLAGSEGTLAIIRRAKVNLVHKPKHTILGVLSYQSIAGACDDVPRLLGFNPSAIELIPQMILQLARSIPAYARQMNWVAGDPSAVLVVEFSGDKPDVLKELASSLDSSAGRVARSDSRAHIETRLLTIAETKEDQTKIWNVRKVGLGILDSRPQTARPAAFIEDCAIPVEHLGEFVREVERIMSAHGTVGGIYAHASAGCLHIRPVLDLQRGEGVRAMRSVVEQVFALTMRLGGSMSSEHGDGISSGEFIERTYGKDLTDAMRALKHAADPDNLLNPNKMFDAPPMDTNLRFGESYQVNVWNPSLHFEHERGLAGAIEHCNGQGVCRKSTGVMCPSFQATREEQNSTRGRANLLRELITNNMSLRHLPRTAGAGGASVTSDEAISTSNRSLLRRDKRPPRNDLMESVAEALDLCLACKGCKAECPSGVDMAKLKFEFENEYYKTHRRPLRDYVFGYFYVTAALASAIAPLSNAVMNVPLFKNVIAKIFGVTTKRPFPKFVRQRVKPKHVTLSREAVKSLPSIARDSSVALLPQNDIPKIIFLSDPFARYIEPDVEQAAFDVLAMCGYDVQVLPVVGAGASLLSKGMVTAAKRHAGKLLDALNQLDPTREAMVVGIEPPEIYCLKNDYRSLLPDRADEIASLSARTWLLDEYLLRSDNFSALRVGKMVGKANFEKGFSTNKQEITSGNALRLRSHSIRPPLSARSIKFQPHCHQRAEGLADDGLPSGTSATVELLRLCGYDVEVLEAGCCGMAGTFGYEAEHYDLSQQVGELKLFPALRALNRKGAKDAKGASCEVASTGAACRMQIQQGAGVEAMHSIILVRDTLKTL